MMELYIQTAVNKLPINTYRATIQCYILAWYSLLIGFGWGWADQRTRLEVFRFWLPFFVHIITP